MKCKIKLYVCDAHKNWDKGSIILNTLALFYLLKIPFGSERIHIQKYLFIVDINPIIIMIHTLHNL